MSVERMANETRCPDAPASADAARVVVVMVREPAFIEAASQAEFQ